MMNKCKNNFLAASEVRVVFEKKTAGKKRAEKRTKLRGNGMKIIKLENIVRENSRELERQGGREGRREIWGGRGFGERRERGRERKIWENEGRGEERGNAWREKGKGKRG